MDRHTRIATLIIIGTLLIVVPPHLPERRPAAMREESVSHDAPLKGGCEVITFYVLPIKDDDEFCYCRITAVGADGIPHNVMLKAKKAMVADSVKCSMKDFFW